MLDGIMKNLLRMVFPLGITVKIDGEKEEIRIYTGEILSKTLTFAEAEQEINGQLSADSTS